jgi:phage terminase small subunit
MKIKPPPKHLSDESKRIWRSIVADYEIDDAAGLILVSTLEAFDRREDARAEIAKAGAVFTDRWGQPKISPWCSVERDSTLIVQRGFRLLGFDQEGRAPRVAR